MEDLSKQFRMCSVQEINFETDILPLVCDWSANVSREPGSIHHNDFGNGFVATLWIDPGGQDFALVTELCPTDSVSPTTTKIRSMHNEMCDFDSLYKIHASTFGFHPSH
jgi:hypothetical protein